MSSSRLPYDSSPAPIGRLPERLVSTQRPPPWLLRPPEYGHTTQDLSQAFPCANPRGPTLPHPAASVQAEQPWLTPHHDRYDSGVGVHVHLRSSHVCLRSTSYCAYLFSLEMFDWGAYTTTSRVGSYYGATSMVAPRTAATGWVSAPTLAPVALRPATGMLTANVRVVVSSWSEDVQLMSTRPQPSTRHMAMRAPRDAGVRRPSIL